MLTNKDYDRLTFQHNRHGGMICGVGMKANLEEIADRLCFLEDKIENRTLVFLPCKVGDIFWRISGLNFPDIIEGKVSAIRVEDSGFVIYDDDNTMWLLDEIYFTKEAAKKALEKLEK